MRILLKLSGEVLGANTGQALDADTLSIYAQRIKKMQAQGHEIAIVTGGGNIMRGKFASHFDRSRADQMGMMATVINAMALEEALTQQGVKAIALSSTPSLARSYLINEARQLLTDGYVLTLAGGTSNPYFTTDSAAALRALELKADLLIKATKVDGIYDADPKKVPNAKRYSRISYTEVLQKKLAVMDLTAITLCHENKLNLRICSVDDLDDLTAILEDESKSSFVGDL